MPDYFTLAEVRALPDMGNTTRYTDDRVEAVAANVVALIERFVGCAFIPRAVTDEVHHGGTYALTLDRLFVRSVTAVSINGTPVTDRFVVEGGNVVWRYASPSGTEPIYIDRAPGRVLVSYVHGYGTGTTPPADIKEAALAATRARLIAANGNALIDDRRTNVSSEQGSIAYSFASGDRPTGYPEVDAVLVGYRDRLDVFGFA